MDRNPTYWRGWRCLDRIAAEYMCLDVVKVNQSDQTRQEILTHRSEPSLSRRRLRRPLRLEREAVVAQ